MDGVATRQIGIGVVPTLLVVKLDVELLQLGKVNPQRATAVVDVLPIQRLSAANTRKRLVLSRLVLHDTFKITRLYYAHNKLNFVRSVYFKQPYYILRVQIKSGENQSEYITFTDAFIFGICDQKYIGNYISLALYTIVLFEANQSRIW